MLLLIAKLTGFLIAAFGLAIFAFPPLTQKIFHFFMTGKRIYYAGIIRAFTGTVLLLVASETRVPLGTMVLGLIFLLSAAVIFFGGEEKMKGFLQSFAGLPPLVVRFFGLMGFCFGLLMIVLVW